jgi:hypothetical protein
LLNDRVYGSVGSSLGTIVVIASVLAILLLSKGRRPYRLATGGES